MEGKADLRDVPQEAAASLLIDGMCQSPWQRDFYSVWSCLGFFEDTVVNPSLLLPQHFHFLFSLCQYFLLPLLVLNGLHTYKIVLPFYIQATQIFLTTVRSYPNIISRPFVCFEWKEKFSSSSRRLEWKNNLVFYFDTDQAPYHANIFLGAQITLMEQWMEGTPTPDYSSFSPLPSTVLFPHPFPKKKVSSEVKVHNGIFLKWLLCHLTQSLSSPI